MDGTLSEMLGENVYMAAAERRAQHGRKTSFRGVPGTGVLRVLFKVSNCDIEMFLLASCC